MKKTMVIQGNLASETPLTQKDKVPMRGKIAFGLGGFAEVLMSNAVLSLALPIYNIGFGLSPILVGYAIGIPRLWEAITDPLFGNITDNTRSAWGRRRPYIFVGVIIASILFAIMWMPPSNLSQTSLFVYFLTVSILYFTAYTIFIVPWTALGFELTSDYNERTRVMAYKTFFGSVGGTLFLPWIYKMCFWLGPDKNELVGVRIVAVFFGLLMICTGILPAIFCKENTQSQSQPKIPIVKAFKFPLTNKPFLMICGTILLMIMAIFLVNPFGMYLNIYYIFGGDKAAGATMQAIGGAIYGVIGMGSVPFVSYLGTHLGKKRTLLLGECVVILASLSTWFIVTPTYPYLQLVYAMMVSFGMTCVWVLTASMIADVCDLDELKSGLRQEGMYSAIMAMLFKSGYAGVIVLSGYMLRLSGFDIELKASQVPQTILNMRILFIVGPVVCVGMAILCTSLYPITEKRAVEGRRVLNERKKSANIKSESL